IAPFPSLGQQQNAVDSVNSVTTAANALLNRFLGFETTYQNFMDSTYKLLASCSDIGEVPGKTGRYDGDKIFVNQWHPSQQGGSGFFLWISTIDKSSHDGGYIISPTVPYSTPEQFVSGSGETDPGGAGCWVRIVESSLTPEMFGCVGDYNLETETGFDNSIPLQAAFSSMSKNKIELKGTGGNYYCSVPPKALGWASVDMMSCQIILEDGDNWGVEFESEHYELGPWTGHGQDSALGIVMQYIEVPDPSLYERGMVIMVRDPNAIYTLFSPNAHRAELFMVADVKDGKVYLNAPFTDEMTSGNVRHLPNNKCKIALDVRGRDPVKANPVRRAGICLKGYVNPDCDVYVHHDASRGFMPISCYGGQYKVAGFMLADYASIGHYGYAASPYGACKGGDYHIVADKCRHAYTDGIYSIVNFEITDGCCVGNTVTGTAISCTSAAWDTHPFSDRTLFNDCQTLGTHQDQIQNISGTNYAYQLRGTNAAIIGGLAETDRLLTYIVPANRIRRSIDTIEGVRRSETHENLNFDIQVWGAQEFTQQNNYAEYHELHINNIRLRKTDHRVADIDYVYHDNCIIDAGDRNVFQTDAVASPGTIQRYRNCRFVSGANYRIYTSTVYLDNCKIDKPPGVVSGHSWSIRGSDTTIYANNVGYIGDDAYGGALWEFGASDLTLAEQPTNCKLFLSHPWGVRRTYNQPLKMVQNYADPNDPTYLQIIYMDERTEYRSAFDMQDGHGYGERHFVAELGFSPEWDGFKWVCNGYRCIGPNSYKPAGVWPGFKFADTDSNAVITFNGSAWV
ncbi:hypothetical protein ACLR2L_17490, partial [Alteromonas sp. AMM-1]